MSTSEWLHLVFLVNVIKYKFVYLKKAVTKKNLSTCFCRVTVAYEMKWKKNIQSISTIHIRCAPEAHPSWICWAKIFLFPFMRFIRSKQPLLRVSNRCLPRICINLRWKYFDLVFFLFCTSKRVNPVSVLGIVPRQKSCHSCDRKMWSILFRIHLWVTNLMESIEM